jgi:hypothetical protein
LRLRITEYYQVTYLEHRVRFVVDNTLHRPEIKSTLRKYSPYSQEFSQIICLNSIFVIEISTCQKLNFFENHEGGIDCGYE